MTVYLQFNLWHYKCIKLKQVYLYIYIKLIEKVFYIKKNIKVHHINIKFDGFEKIKRSYYEDQVGQNIVYGDANRGNSQNRRIIKIFIIDL